MLKQELQEIINNPLSTDKYIYARLIVILHNKYKNKMIDIFHEIQQRDIDVTKAHTTLMFHALNESISHLGIIGKSLLEGKNAREAKSFTKEVFKGDNIAYLMNVVKAYYPQGKKTTESLATAWVFDMFLEQLTTHSDKYLNGSSKNWAETFNHMDYIKLVLKNHTTDKK